MPIVSVFTVRRRATDSTIPVTHPIPTTDATRFETTAAISVVVAPIARRIPISLMRELTERETAAYKPNAAISKVTAAKHNTTTLLWRSTT